jgi:hypothetical protein
VQGRTLLILLVLATPCLAQIDGPSLVEQLRDDDRDWNAMRAMRALGEFDAPPLEELYAALDSGDWQLRQLAARVLWRFIHPPYWEQQEPQGEVTQRLIEVSVEGLQGDRLPYDRQRDKYTYAFNAAEGFHNLRRHARQAEAQLAAGLDSDDYQQRFLCALTLGFGGVSSQAKAVSRVLLPHLRDNDIPEDAKWCTAALYRLGKPVEPFLRAALENADAQQRKLIELLLLDLERPPQTAGEFESRRAYNDISSAVFDPAVEPPLDDWMGWLRRVRDPNLPKPAPPSIP